MIEAPEAYRSEPVERQMGALAASLARISSTARRPARSASVLALFGECMAFIEHTAPRVDPEIGAELADLQVMLALWRESWPEAQRIAAHRTLLSYQAKKWSDRVIDFSGILDSSGVLDSRVLDSGVLDSGVLDSPGSRDSSENRETR